MSRDLRVISREFAAVSTGLREAGDGARLVIAQTESGTRFSTSHTFLERIIPQWLMSFMFQDWREENRATLNYFKEVLGERRIEVLSERCGLDWDAMTTSGRALTKRDVRRLFLEMGNLHLEDAQALFDTILGEGGGALGRAAQGELGEDFEGRKLTQLTIDQWIRMHHYLVPFEVVDQMFLGAPPPLTPSYFQSAQERLARRVLLLTKIWREHHLDPALWASWVTKGMEDRQLASTDCLIPHPKGVLRVYGQFDTNTSDFALWETCTEGLSSVVKFYGLGVSPSPSGWAAFKEVLSKEFGLDGFKKNEEALMYVLGRGAKPAHFDAQYSGITEEPFVEGADERVMAVGRSMGGAIAQHFAEHHPEKVSDVFAVSSPGIGEAACEAFAKRETDPPMRITHMIDVGDVVTENGIQLGHGCRRDLGKEVRVVLITPHTKTEEEIKDAVLYPEPPNANWLYRAYAFFKSFMGPHWEDVTLTRKTYSMASFENDIDGCDVVDACLARRRWGAVREGVADAFQRFV